MSDDSSRLGLPFLAVAQAQKEMTHNEALAKLDIAVQPVVEAVGVNTPPAVPVAGQCWIVGTSPSGGWAGEAGALAGWTGGGWRFVQPFDGMQAWSIADHGMARYLAGHWTVAPRQAAIATPTGGTIIDIEARATLTAILAAMRAHDLIAA